MERLDTLKCLLVFLFAVLFLPSHAQKQNTWTATSDSFSSVIALCEEAVAEDQRNLLPNLVDSLQKIKTGNEDPIMSAQYLYWTAYGIRNLDLAQSLHILDSAETIFVSHKKTYETNRVHLLQAALAKLQNDYLNSYRMASSARQYFTSIEDPLREAEAEVLIGTIYFELGDYPNAVSLLESANTHYLQGGSQTCAVKNQLNLCNALYMNGEESKALEQLTWLINNPVAQTDTAFLINVMVSYYRISDYQDDSYVETAWNLAKKTGNPILLLLTRMNKGAQALTAERNQEALLYYKDCYRIASQGGTFPQISPILYSLSELYRRLGEKDSAYLYLKMYVSLSDSTVNQEALMQYQRAQMRSAIEKAQDEIRQQEEKLRRERWISLGVIGVLIIIGSMGITILFLSRKKDRIIQRFKEAENRELQLQNKNIQDELAAKNRELTSNTLLIAEKNNALRNVLASTEQKLQQNKIPYEEGSQLVFQLKSLIKESNEWSFFKRHFEKVHPDFFLLLKESCPQLSENDLRLCALIRTGMSNKEIAQMLGISLNTVFTTRYRIRKKLGNLLKGNNPDKESSLSEENEQEEHSLEDFLRKL